MSAIFDGFPEELDCFVVFGYIQVLAYLNVSAASGRDGFCELRLQAYGLIAILKGLVTLSVTNVGPGPVVVVRGVFGIYLEGFSVAFDGPAVVPIAVEKKLTTKTNPVYL